MNIAIIGSGNIGRTLAKRLVAAGHRVTLGVRDSADPKVTAFIGGGPITATSAAEAVPGADAVIIAVPGGAVAALLTAVGGSLDGKVVVDAANNVGGPAAHSRDAVAAAAPGAHYVRAFNSLGWENFEDPDYGGVTADLVYCADDDADATARELIGGVGLNPVRVGGRDQADVVDGVLRLWFALAFGMGMGRGLAFKVLTR